MHRTITVLLPAAHDDVFDYIVAGAAGPDRIVLTLTPRQWEYRTVARRAVEEILGGQYHLLGQEPPHRIDLELTGWSGISGRVVCGIAGRSASSLTLHLTADTTGWRRWITPLQRRRITRVIEARTGSPLSSGTPAGPGPGKWTWSCARSAASS